MHSRNLAARQIVFGPFDDIFHFVEPNEANGCPMGGRGSGGHNSKSKLRDVQCARLDVHELARDGQLKLGIHGLLFGSIWFEITGGPDAQKLVLAFPCKSTSGELLDPVRQIIVSYWRKAHFGGPSLMLSST